MSTHIRCFACAAFFDIKLAVCPECETVRRGFSSHLYTSKLNNQLFAQAENAAKENNLLRAMRSGREPDPPKWAKQQARKIVADL